VQLAILRSLKVFKFSFTVDSSQLNYNPDWLTQQFLEQQQKKPTRPAARRPSTGTAAASAPPSASQSSAGAGGSLFGGMGLGDLNLLSSLEKGVDTFINQAVKYLNEAIEGEEGGPMHPSSHIPAHVVSSTAPSDLSSARHRRGKQTPLFGSSLKVLFTIPHVPALLRHVTILSSVPYSHPSHVIARCAILLLILLPVL
jgi:hypothetical protein